MTSQHTHARENRPRRLQHRAAKPSQTPHSAQVRASATAEGSNYPHHVIPYPHLCSDEGGSDGGESDGEEDESFEGTLTCLMSSLIYPHTLARPALVEVDVSPDDSAEPKPEAHSNHVSKRIDSIGQTSFQSKV